MWMKTLTLTAGLLPALVGQARADVQVNIIVPPVTVSVGQPPPPPPPVVYREPPPVVYQEPPQPVRYAPPQPVRYTPPQPEVSEPYPAVWVQQSWDHDQERPDHCRHERREHHERRYEQGRRWHERHRHSR
jgi:hypothetical protein